MTALRTELLIPEMVEVEVEEQTASLARPEGLDELKLRTVGMLRASAAEKKSEFARIDYSSIWRRLIEKNSIPEDQIEDGELEAALPLAYELQFAEETVRAFNDEYFTLLALEMSLGRPATARIRNAHPSLNWLLHAEVGVRHAWIAHHEELLREGTEVKEPFRCRVGDWLLTERKHDREYHTLIRYLHGLRGFCGEEWVLSERSETPDFVLKDNAKKTLGAEMSEVPISQEWADAQRVASRVKLAFWAILRLHGRNLLLYDPDWVTIEDNLERSMELLSNAALSGKEAFVDSAIPIDAELRPSDGEPLLFTSSRRGETGQDIRERESQLVEAILMAIRKKLLKKNGRPRKAPTVRPCDLVLYPNGSPFLDLQRVADLVAERMDLDHTTHFDRIWLISEEAMVQAC